jgi:Cu+-exporting ATPase
MKAHDEVCGMSVDTADAAASVEFQGKTYYFCSDRCRRKFEAHPHWYVPIARDDDDERD